MGDNDHIIFSRTYGGNERVSDARKRLDKVFDIQKNANTRTFLENNGDGNRIEAIYTMKDMRLTERLSAFTQIFIAIKYKIESALLYMGDNNGVSRDILYKTISLIQDSILGMEDIVVKLYPIRMNNIGFVRTMGSLIENFGSKDHVIHFSSDLLGVENSIPGYLKVSIYQVTQELLSYVFQTSVSASISIGLNRSGGRITLAIEEESFCRNHSKEAAEPSAESMDDLEMARSRIEFFKGALDMGGERGCGRRISVRWPCPANGAQALATAQPNPESQP